jgi:hypothetical protein
LSYRHLEFFDVPEMVIALLEEPEVIWRTLLGYIRKYHHRGKPW